MKENEIINAAKARFDKQLHTDEYKKIHSNDEQLNALLNLMDIKSGMKYLDIGTGNGYVAFALAKRYPDIFVWGIDIAENSMQQNNAICEKEKIPNATFVAYDGIKLPFDRDNFYGAVSRYAFHHFPNIQKFILELNRIIKPEGFFLFSDPKTYDNDCENFVDQFQQHMNDGHVHFYKRKEIETYFNAGGFYVQKEFESTIRYPRIMDKKYEELLKKTDGKILDNYKIEFETEKVYITVSVMNILFIKKS
ncbi:methyltransferase type 11 [Candidatus Vecturithrix granuli]|uniref:Methyltransferase type 11 n=1 Tax=Vecturithrix granuli TaxID=1499967 RepID=A0A081C5N5_VECG1|nr:methyltransferase type 11 [Candidatus Vecturithrix granuli]